MDQVKRIKSGIVELGSCILNNTQSHWPISGLSIQLTALCNSSIESTTIFVAVHYPLLIVPFKSMTCPQAGAQQHLAHQFKKGQSGYGQSMRIYVSLNSSAILAKPIAKDCPLFLLTGSIVNLRRYDAVSCDS